MRHSTIILQLLLLSAGSVCSAVGCRGADLARSTRGTGPSSIIGGEETGFERWRGVVALLGDGGEFCTATLIHPRVAVTAGHCVFYPDGGVDLVLNPEQLQVLAGADVLTDVGAAHVSDVEDIEIHFTWEGGLYDPAQRDVALILLTEELDDLEQYPVRIAPPPAVEDPGIIVGYGPAGIDGTGIHRDGQVEVASVDDRLIYVGDEAGACPGDSGGPLFTDQYEEWVLSGVASLANCDLPATTAEANLVTVRDWLSFMLEQWTGQGLPEPDAGPDDDAGADGGDDAGGDGSDQFNFTAHGEACSCDLVGHRPAATGALDLFLAN